tara:strand:+ start:1446 stop:1601 length:156 start_codon:yes stop_codon:yes gene_type:complete
MGIKFSSIVFLILAIFIVKISLENFGQAQASDNKFKVKSDVQESRIKTARR